MPIFSSFLYFLLSSYYHSFLVFQLDVSLFLKFDLCAEFWAKTDVYYEHPQVTYKEKLYVQCLFEVDGDDTVYAYST